MKSFDQFVLEFMERREIDENNAHHLATLIHILDEGKKKKKRKHAEDEEGGAPKTGHEGTDPYTGFEDPLKDYPEQERIY